MPRPGSVLWGVRGVTEGAAPTAAKREKPTQCTKLKPGVLRLAVLISEVNPVSPVPRRAAPQPGPVPAAAPPAPPPRDWPKLSKPLEQLAAHYPVLVIGSG